MLVPIFQKHNAQIAVQAPKDYSVSTLERYKTSLSRPVEFLNWWNKLLDIDICSIDQEFVSDFDFFIRSARKCAINTKVEYIKNFRKIIRICIAKECLNKDPFAEYKARVRVVEKVILCEEELLVVCKRKFTSESLDRVKTYLCTG